MFRRMFVILVLVMLISTSKCSRLLKQNVHQIKESRAIRELREKARFFQEMFDGGSEDSIRRRYDPNRYSPGGPDPRHH